MRSGLHGIGVQSDNRVFMSWRATKAGQGGVASKRQAIATCSYGKPGIVDFSCNLFIGARYDSCGDRSTPRVMTSEAAQVRSTTVSPPPTLSLRCE